MGEWQYVRIEVEDRTAVLAIDNPPVNCLNARALHELDEAVNHLLADDGVKAVIITGGGKKVFVSGAEISEIRRLFDRPENEYGAAREFIEAGHALLLKIEQSNKPFIAAISGFCLGGGLELALACHMRVCSQRTRIGATEVRLGLIPGWGGTQRLPRLINRGKALELILTGDMIGADEAYRLGLVNKVVPRDEVLEAARGLARKIVTKSAVSIGAALRAVHEGLQAPLEEGLKIEAQQFVILADKEDPREGLDAFLEKRPAEFRDR